MTLLHFLRACCRSRDRLSANHERQFAQAVYSKLRGLAAVDEDQCNSIDQIEKQLNYTFGSLKTADECRRDLRNIVQRRGENVVTYIARVRDMRYTLLELECRERATLSRRIEENRVHCRNCFLPRASPRSEKRNSTQRLRRFLDSSHTRAGHD